LESKNPATVEKQKDDDFQKTFQELWPNAHKRLNDIENSSSTMLERLQKEKHDSLLKGLNTYTCKACNSDPNTIICSACRDVCYHKASTCHTTPKLTHHYSCIHYVPTITSLQTYTPQPYIARTVIHSLDIANVKLPELVSVYDRPFLMPAQKEDLIN
jgi:hypothetical protein